MKLIDRTLEKVAEKLAPHLPAHLKAFMPGPGGIGHVDRSYTNEAGALPSLETAFAMDPYVFRALSVIGDTMADVPLKFYREKIAKDGTVEREGVFDHPLVDLFWSPGPRQSGFNLIRDAATHIPLSGEFMWFIENGSTGKSLMGEIQRIQTIRPRHIRNVKVSSASVVSGYTVSQSGVETTFDPEFFVHGKNFNPKSDTRGLSAIEVLQSAVLMSYYMDMHNRNFFRNGASPGFALTTPHGMTDPARKALQEDWDKGHKGVDKAHKTAILEGGVTPVPLSIGAREGEFLGLFNVSRDQKLTALGCPPVIAGVFEQANYANTNAQKLILYQHTIMPIGRLITDAINTQLIATWFIGDPGLYCEFDYSDIDVLQGDRLIAAQIRKSDVDAGIITPNEARLELSLEPIEDQGADDLRTGGGGMGGFLSTPSPQVRKAAIPPTRLDQWKARDADFRRGERALEKVVAQFFEDQGDRVVTALDALDILSGNVVSTVRALDADDLFMIFDDAKEDQLVLEAIMPTIIDIMIQAGNGALASVDSGVEFAVADPRVQAYLAQHELKVAGINRFTEKKLRALLVDATANVQSVSQTSKQIRGMFTQFSKVRADTIARTEVVGANNAAALEGYRQSGVVKKKQWLTAPGADTPRHEDYAGLEGQEVELDGMFDVGGWAMTGPGVDGPAEEVINCRCTVLPVLDDE